MTKEDFIKERLELEAKFDADKKALMIKFSVAQRIFKVGDIIQEDDTIILVDKFSTNITYGFSEPIYLGLVLKKDLTPRKDGRRDSIFGNSRAIKIK